MISQKIGTHGWARTSNPLVNSEVLYLLSYMGVWQGRQDLNLRHPVLETGALPTELLPYTDDGIIP